MKIDEKLVAQHMNKWGCTREEAIDLIMEDMEVDSMTSMKEVDSDLTAEQRKAKKDATKVGTRKTTSYKFEKKARKEDAEKREIIQRLAELAKEIGENVEIVKPEKEVSFKIGEFSYSFSLTRHRNPKS